MLHGRLRELLRLLLAAETPVTSSVIAANVKVTTRTVRNDIKELQTIVENTAHPFNLSEGAAISC